MSQFDLRRWECIGCLPVVDDLPPADTQSLAAGCQLVWLRHERCLATPGADGWEACATGEMAMRLSKLRNVAATKPPGCAPSREPCGVFVSDDGALADYELLGTLGADKQVPFVLGIVRDYVGRNDGVGYMDKSQLHEMARLGCELVSHSVSHPNLSVLSRREIRREIEDSILWMRDQGWAARHFIYPYGEYRVAAEQAIAPLCECACMVTGGVARPPFLRTRLPRHAMGSFFHHGVSTFEGYRSLVDEAVRDKRLLIWMLHPWSEEHDVNQHAILRDLIDYMREVGMRITSLSEAWNMHGNLWESTVGYGGELVLDRDGWLWEAQSRLSVGGRFANQVFDSREFGLLMQQVRKFRNAIRS